MSFFRYFKIKLPGKEEHCFSFSFYPPRYSIWNATCRLPKLHTLPS